MLKYPNDPDSASKRPNKLRRQTYIVWTGSALIGIGKLVIGLLSSSFFTCINAFYTFGILTAKLCLFPAMAKRLDLSAEKRYCRYAG